MSQPLNVDHSTRHAEAVMAAVRAAEAVGLECRDEGYVSRIERERDEARELARGYRDAYNAVNPLASGGHDTLPWEAVIQGHEGGYA
jgi:hypothetical protein